jgi:hypothetical protein
LRFNKDQSNYSVAIFQYFFFHTKKHSNVSLSNLDSKDLRTVSSFFISLSFLVFWVLTKEIIQQICGLKDPELSNAFENIHLLHIRVNPEIL